MWNKNNWTITGTWNSFANLWFFRIQHIIIAGTRLIDWCLTPTLPVFQLSRGVNKFDGVLTPWSEQILQHLQDH
jgi:hypothetical protein